MVYNYEQHFFPFLVVLYIRVIIEEKQHVIANLKLRKVMDSIPIKTKLFLKICKNKQFSILANFKKTLEYQ